MEELAANMRGVVIFDDHTEVAYYHVDREMEKFIRERRRDLELAAGASVSQAFRAVADNFYMLSKLAGCILHPSVSRDSDCFSSAVVLVASVVTYPIVCDTVVFL